MLVGLCWWFLAAGGGMPSAGMDMARMAPPPFGALVIMWWLMMLAMMLPSAAPAILLYARVRQQRQDEALAQPWLFALGYAIVWALFSIIAATIQAGVASPDMTISSADVASAVLIAAGLYQLSPIKGACLRNCRSPVQFITRHWRPGTAGAVRLGLLHGSYCVGCCWLLMALLFVGGVMNFTWIAVLTVAVAAEKILPAGEWVSRAIGVALIGWGAVRLLG